MTKNQINNKIQFSIFKTIGWKLNFRKLEFIWVLFFEIWYFMSTGINLLRKTSILLAILLFNNVAYSQMAPDTLSIPQVEVHSKRKLSAAGIETERVDTLVMMRESTVSLSDLLAGHTSVFIKSEGRGALATASFRGTDASHTAVYWNGISISSPMLGQVDFSQIPVYLMDDISLHPGASSLADGSGGLGGSILLESKLDWSQKWGIKLVTGLGSFQTFNNYLRISTGMNNFRSSTRVYTNSSKNDFPFYNNNVADIDPVSGKYIYPLQRNEQADYHLDGLMQSFALRIQKHYLLSLDYWYQRSSRSIPRLNTYEGDDHANRSHQNDRTYRTVFNVSHFGSKSRLSLKSGLVVENMDYRVKNLILGKDYYNAVFSTSKLLSVYNKLSYQYRPVKHTLLKASLAFDFHHVITLDSVNQTGYNQFRRVQGAFVSWQQQLTKRFSTLVMLRKEWVNDFSVPLIPYFGFDWQLDKKNQLLIHANVARNYHYPDLNDLFWQPGGNPNLLAEEGLASEIGIKIIPDWKKVGLQAGITAFYQNIQHWIIWMPSPMGYWSPENIRHVIAKGLEVNASLNFKIQRLSIFLKAGYAFTKSLNFGDAGKWGGASIGKQIPYVPVHSGNFMADLRWKGYSLSWVNNDYSERFTTSTNEISLRDWLYPYYMNQLYLGKDIGWGRSNVQLQLKIYNLFNEDYRSVLGRPMPGRNYMLVLTFQL